MAEYEEVTLTVPADHLEAFREAVVSEVQDNADWVGSMGQELGDRLHNPPSRLSEDQELADLRSSGRYLHSALELAEQLFPLPASEAEVRGQVACLAHVAEAVARNAAGKSAAEKLSCSPIEADALREFRATAATADWGAQAAVALHEQIPESGV